MNLQGAVFGLVVTGLVLVLILSWCFSQVVRTDRMAARVEPSTEEAE